MFVHDFLVGMNGEEEVRLASIDIGNEHLISGYIQDKKYFPEKFNQKGIL